MSIFRGAGVAIVTPMKDNYEVNYDALETNINYQIDNGTDCIVITGTTGESATLTEQEHVDVIKAAIEFTRHRIPVIAGTGSNSTQTAIELSKEADAAGADGLLVVTPYYNKATQKGLIAHYTAIANAVKAPVVMLQCTFQDGMQPDAGYRSGTGEECGQYRWYQGRHRESGAGCADDVSLRRQLGAVLR